MDKFWFLFWLCVLGFHGFYLVTSIIDHRRSRFLYRAYQAEADRVEAEAKRRAKQNAGDRVIGWDLTAGCVVALVLTTWWRRNMSLSNAAGYLVAFIFVNRYVAVGWRGRIDTIRSLVAGLLIAIILTMWWDIWSPTRFTGCSPKG